VNTPRNPDAFDDDLSLEADPTVVADVESAPSKAAVEAGIASLGEAFFAVEAAEDLYNWRVMGVQVWSVMRSRLLKTLMANSGLFASGQGKQVSFYDDVEQYRGRKPSILLWRAVRFAWLGPLAAWSFAPRKIAGAAAHLGEPDYRNMKSKKAIVVPFATRDGYEPHIEKFAQPVIDALGDRGLVLGVGTWDKITNRPRLEDINGYFNRRWHYPAAVIVRLGVKKADLEKYARVVAALEAQTGFSMDPMRTFPRWMLRIFFIQKYGYRKIFKKTGAKYLFAVNAARMPLQAAAQSLGMKVIEIQSGVFSKYSLQFSWPGSPVIEYIPNEIWTWGDYWTSGIERAGGQQVRVIGSTEEFESMRERLHGVASSTSSDVAAQAPIVRVPGQIVWLSQPLIGLDIFKAAVEFATARPDLKVIFKLHPRNDIAELKSVKAPANLTITQFEKSSLEVIAESEISVGVFSTALIEAAGLGAKVAIIKLPGWEHLAPLIDGGYASAFDNAAGLVAGLDKLTNPADEYFFYGRRANIAEIVDELLA
jgi:hypothetical protein